MLIKKLCIKCQNNIADSFDDKVTRENLRWDKLDEKIWNRGDVLCPIEYEGESRYRYITEGPPINCPYLLEYVLNNQGKKEEVKEIEEPV